MGTRSERLVTDPGASHPFLRYRERLWFHAFALSRGMSDAGYVERVEALDAAVTSLEIATLETNTLRLHARIVDMAYGTGPLPPNSSLIN